MCKKVKVHNKTKFNLQPKVIFLYNKYLYIITMCEKNICEKNKCKKKDQCEFHNLTKQINYLQSQRNKLYEENIKKCNTDKHCEICFCFNPKYIIKTDSGDISNLCGYCVDKIKKCNKPSNAPYEYECPVCGEDDGILEIKKLTNNLCSSCYNKITKI